MVPRDGIEPPTPSLPNDVLYQRNCRGDVHVKPTVDHRAPSMLKRHCALRRRPRTPHTPTCDDHHQSNDVEGSNTVLVPYPDSILDSNWTLMRAQITKLLILLALPTGFEPVFQP